MPSLPLSAGFGLAREARVSDRAWTMLQDHLVDLRSALQDELRTYPTPIAGCDQQFNYLFEKRNRIAAESNGINEALARGDIALATRIVRSSEHIHEDIKASLTTDARDG